MSVWAGIGSVASGLFNALLFWLRWLGVAVGALSLISLVARVLDVGLWSAFSSIVGFYRSLVQPIHDAVERINLRMTLPFQIPAEAVDAFMLYLVLLAMSWRASATPRRRVYALRKHSLLREGEIITEMDLAYAKRTSAFFLWPVITLRPIFALIPDDEARAWREKVKVVDPKLLKSWDEIDRDVLFQFLALPVAVVVFFALNAASG